MARGIKVERRKTNGHKQAIGVYLQVYHFQLCGYIHHFYLNHGDVIELPSVESHFESCHLNVSSEEILGIFQDSGYDLACSDMILLQLIMQHTGH